MKLLVCGSRTIDNYNYISNCLDEILQEYEFLLSEIIEGNAEGVDKLSGLWAKEHNIKLTIMPAEWKKYGKKAGFIRNKEMVDLCDGGIAIWDGNSRGTKMTIDLLKKQNKLIRVFE